MIQDVTATAEATFHGACSVMNIPPSSTQANNTNADVIPCKVFHVDDLSNLNVDKSTMPSDPMVQYKDINTNPTSYAKAVGASVKDQPKVNSNFRPLGADPVFDGVNISIPRKVVKKVGTRFEHTLYGYFIGKRMAFPVVEYYARNNWAKHWLKRIIMNSKGFFFFKFDSRAGLDAVLEGGPWSSFTRCLIEVNSEANLVDVVTIGIPSLTGDGFTKETIRVEQMMVSKRYEPKATTRASKKGATTMGNLSTSSSMFKTTSTSSKKDFIPTSNSDYVLNEEEEVEEDIEDVYDETANLLTKTGGNSHFTAAIG
nr:zinc knuckle CX2CX4HX4C [Tanacetum cinerariifolium]